MMHGQKSIKLWYYCVDRCWKEITTTPHNALRVLSSGREQFEGVPLLACL
jgi:hypothetical protein